MFQAYNGFNFMQIAYLYYNKMENGLVGMLTSKDIIINQYVCLTLSRQFLEAM
jgi:hypothetical protein